MKKVLVLALVVAFASSSAMAVRVVTLESVKDVGLWGNSGTPTDASGSNRGLGGRMDITTTGVGNSSLVQFDLSGVLLPGETISAGVVNLYGARGGGTNGIQVVGYPVAAPWVEGLGTTGGVVGSTGFPWGDAATGDVCYDYKSIGSVIVAATFGNYKVADHAIADHTAWVAGGCKGIGTDVLVTKMIDETVNNGSFSLGTLINGFTVLPAGVGVLNQWAAGTLDNNGISMWSPNVGDGKWDVRAGTRELAGAEPELVLTIIPEPATMCLLGLGAIALIRRRK